MRCGDTPGEDTLQPCRTSKSVRRMYGVLVLLLSCSFLLRTLRHCMRMSLWMKPPWSPPFPALAGTDLVMKPGGGCWPMWSPGFIIALSLKTIAYSGNTWEDTGPEGRTRLQLPILLHAHPTNEAAFSVTGRVPGERDEHSQALRKLLTERPSLPVNNCQSRKHTGSGSYFDVGSVESGWYVGVLKWEPLSWGLTVEVMFGV